METKKTKGRQKIEMKRIEKEKDRLITFVKRRSGIYKKANELVTLTDTDVGIVVFSPAGNAFSFGHPSIKVVANRFMSGQPPEVNPIDLRLEAHRKVRINELNQDHSDLLNQLEVEKERGKLLKQMTYRIETKRWWDTPIDQLSEDELHQMHDSLDELERSFLNEICLKIGGDPGASSSLMAPPPNLDQATNLFPMNNPNPQSYDGFLQNQF